MPRNMFIHLINIKLTNSQGRNYSKLDGHSSCESCVKGIPVDSVNFRKLGDIKSFTIKSVNPVDSPIVHLLFSRCPAAIARFVVAVVINPIKRHPLWLNAHIFKEVSKAIQPSIADRNTTPTVVREKFIAWVKASLFDTTPRIISLASRKTSFCISYMEYFCSLSRLLIAKTTARLNFSINKMVIAYFFRFATITNATPIYPFAAKFLVCYNKSSVFIANGYRVVSHKINPIIGLLSSLYNVKSIESQAYAF